MLRKLLPERPDLKVIVTSATIDTDRFARHFATEQVIEVTGRTFPVEVRYRPLDDTDQVQAIVGAVQELTIEGPGDVLVFLSGEREIRDAADALHADEALEVLPLYARLSSAEQHRIFERFVRGEAAEGKGGLGIGLYLCRTIVERHGGAIGVDSTVGGGAAFWIDLPR